MSILTGKKCFIGCAVLVCILTCWVFAQQATSGNPPQAPNDSKTDRSKVTASSPADENKKPDAEDDSQSAQQQKPDAKKSANGYTANDTESTATKSRPLEDLGNLAVPADLKFDVDLVEKGDFPEFTKELQRAQWRWWDPIDLWVVKPKGVKKPPVVLYLYSYPSDNQRYYDKDYCKFLVKNGFAAVGFVSALTGDRYHDVPNKKWFVSELHESLVTTVHDVQFVLNYLERRGDFDMSRVGIVGEGSGASIAILAATVDPRIKVLDLVNPWGDWPDWLATSPLVPAMERVSYLKPEFLKSVEPVDPMKLLPELKTQRIRLTYIADVRITPKQVRDRIEAAVPQGTKIVNFNDSEDFVSEVTSSGRAFDWIKEQLSPVASSQIAGSNRHQQMSQSN